MVKVSTRFYIPIHVDAIAAGFFNSHLRVENILSESKILKG